MAIYVWSYLKEYEKEKDEVFSALEKVFKSGKLILGDSVKEFENEFSKYCGVPFGVGVANGTDSLFLGLLALGVGAGDEVITVSNTATPTVSAIVSTGAVPVFVDIDPKTYLMDVSQLESRVTKKTKCIIPVHLFGQCVNMDEVLRIARKHGIRVFEDCAQSHGAKFKGKVCGSFGDLGSFSFYPTKILGTYGDGGMVVTANEEFAAKLRRLRFYGMEKTYYALEHGYNSRLDEIHAEILNRKLLHLNTYIAKRKALAKAYDELLSGTDYALPMVAKHNDHAYYLYVVAHPKRDIIIEELKKRDIFVNISYPWPIHITPAYRGYGFSAGDLPHTEKVAKEIFSLPMYPELTFDEVQTVCHALKEISAKL